MKDYVKLFTNTNLKELEDKVNTFMHSLPTHAVISDVKFTSGEHAWDALVLYRK